MFLFIWAGVTIAVSIIALRIPVPRIKASPMKTCKLLRKSSGEKRKLKTFSKGDFIRGVEKFKTAGCDFKSKFISSDLNIRDSFDANNLGKRCRYLKAYENAEVKKQDPNKKYIFSKADMDFRQICLSPSTSKSRSQFCTTDEQVKYDYSDRSGFDDDFQAVNISGMSSSCNSHGFKNMIFLLIILVVLMLRQNVSYYNRDWDVINSDIWDDQNLYMNYNLHNLRKLDNKLEDAFLPKLVLLDEQKLYGNLMKICYKFLPTFKEKKDFSTLLKVVLNCNFYPRGNVLNVYVVLPKTSFQCDGEQQPDDSDLEEDSPRDAGPSDNVPAILPPESEEHLTLGGRNNLGNVSDSIPNDDNPESEHASSNRIDTQMNASSTLLRSIVEGKEIRNTETVITNNSVHYNERSSRNVQESDVPISIRASNQICTHKTLLQAPEKLGTLESVPIGPPGRQNVNTKTSEELQDCCTKDSTVKPIRISTSVQPMFENLGAQENGMYGRSSTEGGSHHANHCPLHCSNHSFPEISSSESRNASQRNNDINDVPSSQVRKKNGQTENLTTENKTAYKTSDHILMYHGLRYLGSLIMVDNMPIDPIRCTVCKERNASIILLPCGHVACCEDCSLVLRKCPICRQYVKGTNHNSIVRRK
uniref:Uncharacterized protein LOC111100409 isoform X3 n=1 Tax=Crassostrea virginica TaxID=6565 RepID=A0A8B8A9Y5_CRAVI|nr:uncharacterized protein LOC111100409 isoform X3 [Crassostrea virginica]